MKDDLIRRQAILEELYENEREDEDIPNRADGVRDAIITVLSIPAADSVPVIRCRDCKYNRNPPSAGNALCDNFYGMTDQNGFCHFGERRSDG